MKNDNTDFDPQIEDLGARHGPGPGLRTQNLMAAGAITVIATAVLTLFVSGALRSPVSKHGAEIVTQADLRLMSAEQLVSVQEAVRFTAFVRLSLAKFRTIEHDLHSRGESVKGLTEMIDQLEMLLKSLDPLRRTAT